MSISDQFEPGSIHVYKIPSVDSSRAKPRPVLITSLPNSEGDVFGILGHTQIQNGIRENQLVINQEDLLSGSLPKATIFPASKQMIFSPQFFYGEVGTVNPQTLEKMMRMVIGHQVDQFQAVVRKPKAFVPGKSVIPPSGKVIGASETKYMIEAALDGWLTTGRFNQAFEKKLAEFLNVRHVLTVNSGSSANLLAVAALTSPKLGERALKPGDEVISVAAGFPTTVNPLLNYGLVPVFVDIELPCYNIDAAQIEAAITPATKAIMLAHTLGNTFDLAKVVSLARKYNLWLIEDCCDALGTTYTPVEALLDPQGKTIEAGVPRHVGTFGDIATLSFYPAHHITMGEGGALFTQNSQLKRVVESFRDWGRDCFCEPGKDNTCRKRFDYQLGELPYGYDHKYTYSHLGFNLKITDLQAACGLAQMDRLTGFIDKRKSNFAYIGNCLKSCEEFLILPQACPQADPAWFGFPITVRPEINIQRLELLRFLDMHKVGTRLLFAGNLSHQPYMVDREYRINGKLTNTDIAMNNTFWIGVQPSLTRPMLAFAVSKIGEYLGVNT